MEYIVTDVLFANQLEQDDLFRYNSEDYTLLSIEDNDMIQLHVLTEHDDYVTLELDATDKVELLAVS